VSDVDEVNAARTAIAQAIEGHPNDAVLFATLDLASIIIAAIAQQDAAEGQRILERSIVSLKNMTEARCAQMSAPQGRH